MDETMNLNGMGISANVPSTPNTTSVDGLAVNTTNDTSSVVVAPATNETVTPTPQPDSVNPNETEELEKAEDSSTDTLQEANNDNSFEDMDMIKELREEEANRRKNDSIFSNMDFGPLKKYLDDDDVTDISYSNGGQLWLKTLSKGVYRIDEDGINDALIEKIAFQCSNIMGKTFNMAHPFLDSESAELRMNFIHDSIARNGIAVVFRKTPAKIRLEKDKLMKENYVSLSIHDFLIKAVQGHCNIIMCGETGSGKTEFLKYLASHTAENEKIVTVEDTLELHLDRIYPHRDIVAMKTNNIASYSDVLVTCMRQNPIWILLSEVRSAEAVTAVRNSISSGHFILSTIHADKASNIPYRLYSLLESNIDVEQFMNTIYRYIQLGVFLRGRFDPRQGKYVREIGEVTEFYVNDNNECVSNTIYQKTIKGDVTYKPISEHLLDYLEGQGMDMTAIRASNGDLEKAQNYTDEHSEPVDDATVPEEKPIPITQEVNKEADSQPETLDEEEPIPITQEVKQDTNLPTEEPNEVEEKPIPITQEIKQEADSQPETLDEEKPVPITQEVKQDASLPTEKPNEGERIPIPITQEVRPESDSQPTPAPNVNSAPSPMIDISQQPVVTPQPQPVAPTPAVIENQTPVINQPQMVQSITPNENSNPGNQTVNFTPPNITNIQ